MKCGIYKIECLLSGNFYIGSSSRIGVRWNEHRKHLRRGTSVCRGLQNAWKKYGEQSFVFSVLEECDKSELERLEQHYIDLLKPKYNTLTNVQHRFGAEMLARRAASLRARAALITHCPRGHPYDEANTYINKKGKRICRACNALRVAAIYASETPEQTRSRLDKSGESYRKNLDERRAKQKQYMATRKAEKREYDRQRRGRLKAQGARRRKKAKATVSTSQMSMF